MVTNSSKGLTIAAAVVVDTTIFALLPRASKLKDALELATDDVAVGATVFKDVFDMMFYLYVNATYLRNCVWLRKSDTAAISSEFF